MIIDSAAYLSDCGSVSLSVLSDDQMEHISGGHRGGHGGRDGDWGRHRGNSFGNDRDGGRGTSIASFLGGQGFGALSITTINQFNIAINMIIGSTGGSILNVQGNTMAA
jgi:hypothetical protein